MRIIFCSDYWEIWRPDRAYATEAANATAQGLNYSLMSYEDLVDRRDAARAVRRVETASELEPGIYRGWMLRSEAYERMYEALLEKGIRLITDPAAYRHCYYLPESYAAIEGMTPRSVWLPVDIQQERDDEALMAKIMEVLKPFGDRPIIVKDYVKARKHEWYEACYIPSASNRQEVERVVKRFMELQGEDLQEGLVFREFIHFEQVDLRAGFKMPFAREFRVFVLDGHVLASAEFWGNGEYGDGGSPPFDELLDVVRRVQSRFFTMDVAPRLDGKWMIMELGDGQVATLPQKIKRTEFYRRLAAIPLTL